VARLEGPRFTMDASGHLIQHVMEREVTCLEGTVTSLEGPRFSMDASGHLIQHVSHATHMNESRHTCG